MRHRPAISLEVIARSGTNCVMDRSEVEAQHKIPEKVTSLKQCVRNSTFAEWFLMDVFREILYCQLQGKGQYHNL